MPVGQPEEIWAINAEWCQGTGWGFWPTDGGGLTLNLTGGDSIVSGVPNYLAASSLTLTDNTTNYVYLNASGNPAVKTSSFVAADIPIAVVVTASGVITSIRDLRAGFVIAGSSVISSVGITIDGGGSVPGTGTKGFIRIPYACTITGWTILADQSGSCSIGVKKSTYAGFPTTSSIVASAPPNLSSQQNNTSTTLTGWTTTINAGDVLEFDLNSVTTCQRITLELQLSRT